MLDSAVTEVLFRSTAVGDIFGVRWPSEAHDPRLGLAGTAHGAEWIDAFAAGVKPTAIRSAPPVLGHVDWSGKHFRFVDDRITVVYDWDSVRVATEAVIVGNAAVSFTANWDLPDVDRLPSLMRWRVPR